MLSGAALELNAPRAQEPAATQPPPCRSAAFFDIDHTLIGCNTELKLARAGIRSGAVDLSSLALIVGSLLVYRVALGGDAARLKQQAYRRALSHLRVEQVNALCREVFSTDLRQGIYADTYRQIALHRERGDQIVLVSGALQSIVDLFGAHLGADHCYGSDLPAGPDGGAVVMMGEVKAATALNLARQRGLDLAACSAYGDHWEDRHLLHLVGHPVAVNPDRRLRRLALGRRWPVRRWA